MPNRRSAQFRRLERFTGVLDILNLIQPFADSIAFPLNPQMRIYLHHAAHRAALEYSYCPSRRAFSPAFRITGRPVARKSSTQLILKPRLFLTPRRLSSARHLTGAAKLSDDLSEHVSVDVGQTEVATSVSVS
jgi:hypothetical protein